MIPSLVQQITAACMPRPAERPSPRKLRQENILMLMLGRNVTALDLSRHQKKSLRMIADDLRELIDAAPVLLARRAVQGPDVHPDETRH